MPKSTPTLSSAAEIEIVTMPCIITGAGAPPLPIKQTTENGRSCVPFNSSEAWINKVLGDRCRGKTQLILKRFIDEMIQLLKQEVEERSSTTSATSDPVGSSRPGQTKGRKAFGLDSDSDEVQLEKQSQSREPSRKRKLVSDQHEFRTIEYRGVALTAKVRARGRGLVVALEGDGLPKVLELLREQVSNELEPTTEDVAKKQRRSEVIGNRDGIDAGRIRWLIKSDSYQIMYCTADGKQHTCTKDLRVGRIQSDGSKLTDDAFEEARVCALHKARALWNMMDCSGAARYADPVSAGG